jgi:hypothetical protein
MDPGTPQAVGQKSNFGWRLEPGAQFSALQRGSAQGNYRLTPGQSWQHLGKAKSGLSKPIMTIG